MKPGRRMTPTKLQLIHGNPRKTNLKAQMKKEPQPKVSDKVPLVPVVLRSDLVAKKEWARVAKQLHQLGLLTEMDMISLIAYCSTYSQWIEATEMVKKYGMVQETKVTGRWSQSPWATIQSNKFKELRQCISDFGMSPSSRSSVKAADIDKKSSFESYMASKKKK